MEIASIVLARTIGLVETGLFNPHGNVSVNKLVSLIANRFSFMSAPSKLQDFENDKGVVFKKGYFNGESIEELAIYNDGIKIDARSSTENAQAIILESLEWLKQEAGIYYAGGMIPRWAFLSQIVVRSEMNFNAIHPAFTALSERVEQVVNSRTGENFAYRFNGISVDFQKLNGDYPIAAFTLERRVKTPDEEKLYFSQAPMQTNQHFETLVEFERNLSIRR